MSKEASNIFIRGLLLHSIYFFVNFTTPIMRRKEDYMFTIICILLGVVTYAML